MFEGLLQTFTVFPHATAAGILTAVVCSALGTFVLFKRIVFVSIALSETAALGVALSLHIHMPPELGAGILTLILVALLAGRSNNTVIPRDAVLGTVVVLAGGLSILVAARSGFGLHEVKSLLYGDLILTSPRDLSVLTCVLAPAFVIFMLFLRPILYVTLDPEAARVMGMRVVQWELIFFCCLGLTVSTASKQAGTLLVFCYLVVPPTCALLLTKRLCAAMWLSVGIGCVSTLIGLSWSLAQDLPANQTIAVVACIILVLTVPVKGFRRVLKPTL